MSSQCPIGSFQGPQQLTGFFTQSLLGQIENRDKPFFIDIAPSGIRPNVYKDWYIADNQNNLIEIDGVKYNIFSLISIYRPVHLGYKLPTQPSNENPVAELIIQAFSQSMPQKAALICFPIFITNNISAYSEYLDQLWNSEAKVANLQTLFMNSDSDKKQVSISYVICTNQDIKVYVFPNGISMPSSNWQKLQNIIGSPRDIKNIFHVRLNQSSLLSITSDDFKNRFIYNSKPAGLRGRFQSGVCPSYRTSEYKCVPFDRIRDLEGDKVVLNSADTLAERLQEQDKTKSKIIDSLGGTSSDTQVGIIVASVAGASLGAFLVFWAASLIVKRIG